jgi:ABC-2 type transport system ATP-binding protein
MSVIVNQLSKKYAEQQAVDGISFKVGKGEILGFLGPNGAGKSTTMKMLTCFIPPSGGSASICGFDIVQHPLEVKRKIGYLPENNPLYYDMYVKEFLEFTLRIHHPYAANNSNLKIKNIIDRVGLQVEQHKKIGQLSRGYKQRVGLAQALLHDPEVLILDEPTSGLDPNQLADIRALIKELGKEKTILFSTHIMQEVQAVCDRVIIINKGKLVADDKPEQLQARVSGNISVEVEFENAVSLEELQKISHVISVDSISAKEFIIQGDDSLALRKALFSYTISKGNTLLTLKASTKSLEDIFQQLTYSSTPQ